MNAYDEVVEKVNMLSTVELEEIKNLIDQQLTAKRIKEIEAALAEAKHKAANGKLTFYKSGEDLLASLNEDK